MYYNVCLWEEVVFFFNRFECNHLFYLRYEQSVHFTTIPFPLIYDLIFFKKHVCYYTNCFVFAVTCLRDGHMFYFFFTFGNVECLS